MKKCTSCSRLFDLDQFSFKNKAKNIYQSRCKNCYSEYNRKYYQDGEKVKQLERVKANNKQLRQQFNEWKKQHKCCVCGENSPECLDFHHLDPTQKEKSLSRAADFGSWKKIMEEAAKCIVVCANCHRKIHSGKIIIPR